MCSQLQKQVPMETTAPNARIEISNPYEACESFDIST